MATKDTLKEQYDKNVEELDKEKEKALAEQYRSNELIMKYLPEKMAQMGNKNTGITETSLVKAYGDYATNRANIAQTYATDKNKLFSAYQDNLATIEDQERENKLAYVEDSLQKYVDSEDYLGGLEYLEGNKDLYGSNYQQVRDNYLLSNGYSTDDTLDSIRISNIKSQGSIVNNSTSKIIDSLLEENGFKGIKYNDYASIPDGTTLKRNGETIIKYGNGWYDVTDNNELSKYITSERQKVDDKLTSMQGTVAKLNEIYAQQEKEKEANRKNAFKNVFDAYSEQQLQNQVLQQESLTGNNKQTYEGSDLQDVVEFIGGLFESAGLIGKELANATTSEVQKVLLDSGIPFEKVKEFFKNHIGTTEKAVDNIDIEKIKEYIKNKKSRPSV